VSLAEFEENLARKMADKEFIADIGPLLASGYEWDVDAASIAVSEKLLQRLA
jgi:hypothetical protein